MEINELYFVNIDKYFWELLPEVQKTLQKLHVEGKKIEYFSKLNQQWIDVPNPHWRHYSKYRLSPDEIDLTTIDVPFGQLPKSIQDRLELVSLMDGNIQIKNFYKNGWYDLDRSTWQPEFVYRMKPTIDSSVDPDIEEILSMDNMLREITTPFGMLYKPMQEELKRAHGYGNNIEYYYAGKWQIMENPLWFTHHTYRLAPKPELIPDSINWDHVHPDFNYLARDRDGTSVFFSHEPTLSEFMWVFTKGVCCAGNTHTSYKQGTVDWKDSLVKRPS